MSIFSNIKKSRQQAKQHNAKAAEQQQKEIDAVPYRHVPTHAATDAYASAPPSWREADRTKIAEQNRRRGAMAASGHHMNMPGIPRVGSSLSHVSYPGDDTGPMVRMRMPRAYSYNGASPYPERTRDVLYSVPDLHYTHQPTSIKGKEVSRAPASDTPRLSPTSSKGEHSPSRSSSGSASSQDGLEMKTSQPAPRSADARERTHRLHPSSRRNSDTSDRHSGRSAAKGSASAHSSYTRDSRPPPSMRGFSSVSSPPVPATIPLGSHPAAMPTQSSVSKAGSRNSQIPANASASRHSSIASLQDLAPVPSGPAASNPVTPAAIPETLPESPLQARPTPSQVADVAVPVGNYFAAPPSKYTDRRMPRATRFTELERIESLVEPRSFDLPRADSTPASEPVAYQQIVNILPEPAEPVAPVPEVAAPWSKSKSKAKKLTKGSGGSGKLVKKNRWSSSSSSAVAV